MQYQIQFYHLMLFRGLRTQLPTMLGCELVRWVRATLFSSAGLPYLPWGALPHIPDWGFVTDVPQALSQQSTTSDGDSPLAPRCPSLPILPAASTCLISLLQLLSQTSSAGPLHPVPLYLLLSLPSEHRCSLGPFPLGCAASDCSHTISPTWAQ